MTADIWVIRFPDSHHFTSWVCSHGYRPRCRRAATRPPWQFLTMAARSMPVRSRRSRSWFRPRALRWPTARPYPPPAGRPSPCRFASRCSFRRRPGAKLLPLSMSWGAWWRGSRPGPMAVYGGSLLLPCQPASAWRAAPLAGRWPACCGRLNNVGPDAKKPHPGYQDGAFFVSLR